MKSRIPFPDSIAWRSLWDGRILFFLLLLSLCATADAQNPGAEEQPSNITTGEVIAVVFRGNHALSSDELATVVTTKAVSGTMNWLYRHSFKLIGSDYEPVSQPTLDRDTAALNQYYHNHGFIDARSSYQIFANRDDLHNYYEYIRQQRLMTSPGESPGAIPVVRDTVVFSIQEGKPFTISRISVEGLETLPNQFQAELNNGVTIKTGERWSRPAAGGEVQRLTNIMIENGYPNAHYDSIVAQNQAGSDTVRVLLYMHPGHRYKYGAVHIVYDSAYGRRSTIARNVILAQLFTDSGHWYKFSEIQRSEAALNKLGMFDLFRVSLDTNYINSVPDSLRDSLAVPVEVFLRMKEPLSLPVAAYIATSTQAQIVFGFSFGVNYKNFWHLADNLNFQVSYQPLPTSLLRYSGSLDYTFPYIGLGRVPLILGAGYSHQVQTSPPATDTFVQATLHAGSSFILSHADDKTTLNPDFLIDYVNTQSQDSSIRAYAPAKQINVIPSITYQDNRANDLINPTAGNILSAEFETGLPTDLFYTIYHESRPSSWYYKIVPQSKNYFDVSNNGALVIATRIQIGMTYIPRLDTNQYPSLDRRFYGGGAISNRGWAEQSLLVSANPQQNAVDGGFNDLEASVELRYAPFQYPEQFTTWQKFSQDFRVVLFYDIGNVWDNVAWQTATQTFTFNSQALSFRMLAESIGIGLRYNFFFGALRFDWGFKLYDPSGRFDNSTSAIDPYTAQGQWLFSGHHSMSIGNISSFHFGIGQAF